MKADITYAPELVGDDARRIAEREFLKLQSVIAQLADVTAGLQERLEKLESNNESASG